MQKNQKISLTYTAFVMDRRQPGTPYRIKLLLQLFEFKAASIARINDCDTLYRSFHFT